MNKQFAESERLGEQRSRSVSPTEAAKEAFRTAYKTYQESSLSLAAAQKELLAATAASSEIFRSSRNGAGSNGVEDWDGGKATKAADAITKLALHYEIVAQALYRQGNALRAVTEMATSIVESISPEQHAP